MLSLSTIGGSAAYYAAEGKLLRHGRARIGLDGEGADRLGLVAPLTGPPSMPLPGKLPDGTELSRIVDGKSRLTAPAMT